jgi:hypothetical protein
VDRVRTIPIMSQADIYAARMTTRQVAIEIGMNLIDQARISLATSSLATCLKMGGNSALPDQILITRVVQDELVGIRLTFITRHPSRRTCLDEELSKINEVFDVQEIEDTSDNALKVTLIKWVIPDNQPNQDGKER